MSRVLIMGSGGREHALGYGMKKSDNVKQVFFAPGNAGTSQEGTNVPLSVSKKDFPAIARFVKEKSIDLVVVGPEAPLVDGLVDYLHANDYHRVFGPSKAASWLEADKFFSYNAMRSFGIPQARGILCYSHQEAAKAIAQFDNGVVLKARGLTGGKGVAVFDTQKEAQQALAGHAQEFGPHILVAERLYGEEFSVFGICDGERVKPIYLSAQDHKRLLDGDQGPNTGGMGAYAPAPVANARVVAAVAHSVLEPLIQGMKEQWAPFTGFIYAGMMMTQEGPKVIEFNVRFGDPECQPIMKQIDGGLFETISAAIDGNLTNATLNYNMGASCCVVLAMPGYPKSYQKGEIVISGLEDVANMPGVKVFHSGTAQRDGNIVTAGGRVLGVTASGAGIRHAKRVADEAAARITIPGGFHYRTDIAARAINRTAVYK